MSIFDKFKKITKNENAFLLNEDNPYEVNDWISTGCFALNAVLSDGDIWKGIADGKRIMLAGESGTAKSLFTTYLIESYLKNKKNSKVVFFESEGSSTVDMAKQAGIPEEMMLILPVMTVEETRTQMVRLLDEIIEERKRIDKHNKELKINYEKALKKAKTEIKKSEKAKKDIPKLPSIPKYEVYEHFIFVLDSLGMLGTIKETTDVSEGNAVKDMTRTQLLRGFARVVSLKLAIAQCPFLIVNHTYQTFDKYSPEKVSGGGGPRYMADIILVLIKRKVKDEDDKKKQIGVEIRCVVEKSRYMQENKFVRLLLSFKKGLFKYSHLVTMGEELEVFNKEGFSFILPDGEKVKMKDMRSPATSVPYFNDKVLKDIGLAIKKEFEFGSEESL